MIRILHSKHSHNNLRFEIPARAFINAQIIQNVRKTPDFLSAVNSVVDIYKQQGLEEYQFENPAYVASLLYCLIVVPKELWACSPDSPIYDEIRKLNIVPLFRINITSPKFDSDPAFGLILCLRNSVAHANYSVDSDMNFTFWNTPSSKKKDKTWEAFISAQSLMDFLSKVGSLLANKGLQGEA